MLPKKTEERQIEIIVMLRLKKINLVVSPSTEMHWI